ncbi:hypothetical protein CRE_31538 [Caenorhabditis remanei]|uniref:Uncharacterized protein n=1 Tax=Caenorhabditis remanei TaxID=31234 RepID=E3NI50_CAERE|nr:hypothetical protein CRE_31538 [Caenorhabditis remanei]
MFFLLLFISSSLVSEGWSRKFYEENYERAFQQAESEILPFRSQFSKDNSMMLNYSIAALAAIKVSKKIRDPSSPQKLPRHLCPLKKYKCSYGKYRHFDGRCTNVFSPLSGSTYSPFSRRLPANYDDGITLPRFHGYRNHLLPPVDVVEKQVVKIPAKFEIPLTPTFLDFSDFLYMDLARFVKLQDGVIGCCGVTGRSGGECLNIGEQYASLKSNYCIDRQFRSLNLKAHILKEKYELRAAHCDGGSCHEVEANTLNEYGSAVGLFHKFMTTGDKSQIFNPSLYSESSTSSSSGNLKLSEILLKGRDHGVATYAEWRKECGGGEVTSYEQLIGLIDDRILKSVRDLFPDIRDVDLILLGVAENPVYGSLLGPTFGCIMALQFQKTKFGDSYWYTNKLNDEQLEEVKKVSISGLMCRNQKTSIIQKDGFRAPDNFQCTISHDKMHKFSKFQENMFLHPKNFRKPNFKVKIAVNWRFQLISTDFSINFCSRNIPIFCNSSVFSQPDFSKWFRPEKQLRTAQFDSILGECIRDVSESRRRRQSSGNLREGLHNSVALKSYGSMMLAKDEAVNEANISFILLEATRKLITGDRNVVDLERIQGIYIGETFGKKSDELCNPKDFPCDPTNPYRTYTGWCNNLATPSLGNTFRELKRLLPPAYEDGIDLPRSKTTTGAPLPSPRVISNTVHHAKKIEHVKYSHFVMEFGQFIDHDITHSPVDQNPDGTPLNCSRCDSSHTVSPSCFPIAIPETDLHFAPFSCLSFVRSLPAQKTLGYRNQMNQVSAFLDGSVMYGSTKCEGDRLRTFQDGKMKTTQISNAKRHYGITLSQSDESEQDGCVSSPEAPCFIAGDDRNSQQTLLIAVHSVFHREHERVSSKFKDLNPHWDDERIYQETRKLISAQFAHIVYHEYLPIVIGQKLMDDFDLRPRQDGYYGGYDAKCDASILQPFATAAFRFGHSTVTRFTPMQETVLEPATRVVDLAADFLNMSKIYSETDAVEQILGGMHAKHQMMTDRFVDDAVRNFLFSDRGRRGTGLDLIAINIQRGRDHGIPPYNHYRTFCGLSRLTSFYSIFSDIDQDGLTAIGKVYESPDDIDLFTGIVAEKTVPGGIVGPTAACIIAEQFRRLKKCDRFYYENEKRFSVEQLKEIRTATTMSALICGNTKVSKIAKDVFSVPEPFGNPLIDCDLYPKLDLSKWRDAKDCVHKGKTIALHSTAEISPCTKCTCTSDGDPICFMQCAHQIRDT